MTGLIKSTLEQNKSMLGQHDRRIQGQISPHVGQGQELFRGHLEMFLFYNFMHPK